MNITLLFRTEIYPNVGCWNIEYHRQNQRKDLNEQLKKECPDLCYFVEKSMALKSNESKANDRIRSTTQRQVLSVTQMSKIITNL